jgi:hypothetical protein
VDSPHISIPPGEDSYNVMPTGFQANCPSGYTVLGTGYYGDIGKTTSVLNYGGFFVGGFVINDTNVTMTDVHLQAMCGVVPGGASAAADTSGRTAQESAYQETAKRLHRLRR